MSRINIIWPRRFLSSQKIRGGYYTPRILADYLCRWAICSRSDRIIEPSCGDGSFVSAAAPLLGEKGLITAIEIAPREIEKAKKAVNGSRVPTEWKCGSFFDVVTPLLKGRKYDVAVGNPPFIRFQYFDRQERDRAFHLVNLFGYRPTGLANAWITFVQLSAELLRDGGRLAMVVPAELLQVKYAAELRYRLPMMFEDVYIVAFDELVFPGIQQEVVLLLAKGRRRYSGNCGRLHTWQVANGEALLARSAMSEVVIRNRWFDVPSVAVPDAFLFRQIHKAPLLVANHAGATSTDTIHRVRIRGDVDRDRLCASMVNSLTFAWAEVCGRSYGGGVLELEPREAENLFVPYRFTGGLDVDFIDARLRAGDMKAALDHGDDILLRRGCGLSKTDVRRAREGWDRLRQRRQRRRHDARMAA